MRLGGFKTGDQPFTLTLPPQGIGEEMPKNDKDASAQRPSASGSLRPHR